MQLDAVVGPSGRRTPVAALSLREREVLALMAEGRSNAAIAAALVLSLRTVETHVCAVFTKLGIPEDTRANRRVLAVLIHLRDGTEATPVPSVHGQQGPSAV